MFILKQYNWKKYNIPLTVIVLILCIIGVFMISCIDEDGFLVKKQIFGVLCGTFFMAVVSVIDYHFICRFAVPLYIFNIILLVLVKFSPLGVHLLGATRWLNLYFLQLQPSELTKVTLIICFAAFYDIMKEKMNKFSTLILAGIILVPPLLLIYIQPHLSTCMILVLLFVAMIYIAGLSFKIILPIIGFGVPIIGGLLWYVLQPWQKLITKTQQSRILGFLNPSAHQQGVMFQQSNAKTAIGSGKLYGKLFANNPDAIRGSSYISQNESDFIYSVIGEELGFIGGCIIIALLAIVIFMCIKIARRAKDYTGMMLASGVASLLMFQVFVNIGVATETLPNTGQPLPFISYGLTTLICCMTGIGLVINVGLQSRNNRR